MSLFSDHIQTLASNERPRWPGADTRERHEAQAEYIDMLRRRHATQKSLRDILDNEGYISVDTSILQKTASGAAARTFDTTANFDGREHVGIATSLYRTGGRMYPDHIACL